MPLQELAPFALVMCLGIFTQAATGFAGGLVIMPLMLWAGHGIPEAQAALLTATIPQNLLGIFQFRRKLPGRDLLLPGALRLAFIPLGVAALYLMDSFPVERVRQLVGLVVVICVVLLLAFQPKPREKLHPAWTWLAFSVSGFFAGCTGTGGPFMVLWVQAHDWGTQRIRAFLFGMYLISIPPILGLLYWTFGNRITATCLNAMVLLPLLLCVTWVGLRVGSWLGRQRLRRITMGILLMIGALGVLAPVLKHLWPSS